MIRARFSLPGDSTGPRVPRKRPKEPTPLSRRDFLTLGVSPRRADGTWRVTIDADGCMDCNACTRICGEAALRRSQDDSHVVYLLNLASCTGCSDCEVVCAAKALRVRRDAEVGRAVIEIVRLPTARCSGCGQERASLVNGVCPVCRPTGMLDALRR